MLMALGTVTAQKSSHALGLLRMLKPHEHDQNFLQTDHNEQNNTIQPRDFHENQITREPKNWTKIAVARAKDIFLTKSKWVYFVRTGTALLLAALAFFGRPKNAEQVFGLCSKGLGSRVRKN